MKTRRQLTLVLAVSTGALLVVATVAVGVVATVRGELVRMTRTTSPLELNLMRLQSGFERVSGDFTRISAATDPAELAKVEAEAEATLKQVEAISAEIGRVAGAQDAAALTSVTSVHRRLKDIAMERLEARRRLAESSGKLRDELNRVTASTEQLTKSMESLEQGSEKALEAARKTTEDSNTSIKSMLVLRENCEKLRALIQEPKLVEKRYRLGVSKDKVKAVLDAMTSQPVTDKRLSGEVAKFAAAFGPAFEGSKGLLALRTAELEHPQDTKVSAAFEGALKALNGSVDGLAVKVSETIDPLELSVRNANVGMGRSTEMMVQVAAIMNTTAKVNAEARSLQALALQLVAAGTEGELNQATDAIRKTADGVLQELRRMKGALNGLKRNKDAAEAETCARLFEQVREETTGAGGMGELMRAGLQKQEQVEQLFREALAATERVTSEGSVKTREAETAQENVVSRIEHVSTLALATILILGLGGLAAAWVVGWRVRDSILAGEAKVAAVLKGLRAMVEQVSANAKTLRVTSTDLSSTSEAVTERLGSIIESNNHMRQSVEAVGQSIDQVVTVGASASEVAGKATATIESLRASSEKIEQATEKIRGISFQTNLLALNATIEAAHAGEAGLGFAVVANEVKVLAKTSAAITEEIDACTAGMRAEVVRVDASIGEIQRTIGTIRELQREAAKAVGEHAAKAQKMSQDVFETADTCNGVDGKAGVRDMAKQLATMAETLEGVCRRGLGKAAA